jgi:hypothetical protein
MFSAIAYGYKLNRVITPEEFNDLKSCGFAVYENKEFGETYFGGRISSNHSDNGCEIVFINPDKFKWLAAAVKKATETSPFASKVAAEQGKPQIMHINLED